MQDQIVQYLKSAEGYLSGEEISRNLKVSRAGIWKHMQELRQEGYEIAAVPHLGYRLVSCPDKLLAAEIQSGLGTEIIGREIRYFDTIESTMTEAFRLGVEGAAEGTIVCAESQTKGKGRLGRGWISPKGKGIYMSIILRPRLAPVNVAQLTLLSAVVVCEAVRQCSRLPAKIKWPNDVFVRQKKLAGILTEISAEMDRVRFAVIGVGVNVNTSDGQLPPNATSIKGETGCKFSRVVLMQEILRLFELWYGRLSLEGFPVIVKRWKELSSTLGQYVRVEDPQGDVYGQAVGLDEYGGLVVRSDAGLIIKRMTGDVMETGSV